jgi:hypothetical protein
MLKQRRRSLRIMKRYNFGGLIGRKLFYDAFISKSSLLGDRLALKV